MSSHYAFLLGSFFGLLVLAAAATPAETPTIEPGVFESSNLPVPETEVDKLVAAKLPPGLPSVLCSDSVFIRRVYLDLLGTLPTAKEAKDFIQDPDVRNKRRLLIDRLLERPEFVDYWAMKWGDLLRIKAEFPVNLWPNAAQAYNRWVRASIADNKPYDRFVRELLTSSGSNFRVGPVNFYRAIQNRTPDGIARAVALTFMGARADSWPSNRLAGMTPFFSHIGYKATSEWKEEHVFWDPLGTAAFSGVPGRASIAPTGQSSNAVPQAVTPLLTNPVPLEAVFPDGTPIKLSADRDPREIFADWLITPRNPWFTRSIVNRAWAWFLGRGIIHEVDDIREDNPPSNPALLAYLEKEMVAKKYDLKQFYRLVLNSRTYQRSSMPRPSGSEAEAAGYGYTIRRLEAEVLIDAINKVTGTSDLYTSPIPEPFTYIPKGMPAVAIADGSITSPFLALFGRSARATGMANERNHKPTPAQWLYLLNSTEVQRKLEQGTNMQAIIGVGRKRPNDILEQLYLTILTRFPTPGEVATVEAYRVTPMARAGAPGKAGGTNSATVKTTGTNANDAGAVLPGKQPVRAVTSKTRDEWVDVAWSLINSEEFLYRH